MGPVAIRTGSKTMLQRGTVVGHYWRLWDYEAEIRKDHLRECSGNRLMTKTKIERPDVLEIAAMRARWKEDRAAGDTGETFAQWRKRVKTEVIDELRKALNGDERRWPDERKRDLDKPERRKRLRTI
jgi:hypothetical protein